MALSNTDLGLFKAVSVLGGAISTTELAGTKHELFDKFTGIETRDGVTIYACLYVKNKGAETADNVTLHINSESAAAGINAQLGLGTSAINASEAAIANETTAPAGVTFIEALDEENGLSIGSLAAGARKAVWVMVEVDAGTAAFNNWTLTPEINFDTGA